MIRIYGNLLSQPCRAVIWTLMMIQKIPYELITVDTNKRNEMVHKLNPRGSIPILVDGDFVLTESSAILIYICEKLSEETDLYPRSDLRRRAKINEYLHFHHTSTRNLTFHLFRPRLIEISHSKSPSESSKTSSFVICKKVFSHLELLLSHTLPQSSSARGHLTSEVFFLAGGSLPSIADLVCYCEIDQIENFGYFDFSKYPHLNRWTSLMKTLPFYNE